MTDRIVHITSRSNPLLIHLRKLADSAALARRDAVCWLEGDHLVRAAVARRMKPVHVVITQDAWAEPALQALTSTAEHVAVVPAALMKTLASVDSPASIACLMALPPTPQVDGGAATVVLDRLQDPGNVGNILRSAAAFGFHQVLALRGTVSLWSPKVLRAGMGSHFALSLIEQADDQALGALRLPWLGTSSHAAVVLGRQPLPWPCAWVMGHEGQGVSAALLARCAVVFRIHQPGGEESLNVAAAAAVCLHESARFAPMVGAAPTHPSTARRQAQ